MEKQLRDGYKGLSGSELKTIAILAMLVDHIAYGFLPYFSLAGSLMHFLGRITGPVMFFMLAEGYFHTGNIRRYTLRLAFFAAVSYLPFVYFISGRLPDATNFLRLNVLYTMLVALLSLRAWFEIKNLALRLLALSGLLLAATLGDWGVKGVVITLIFAVFRGDFKKQATAYLIFVGAVILSPLLSMLSAVEQGSSLGSYPQLIFVLSGMVLPILLLRFYNGTKGRGNKWFFYVFYPLHLALLGLLKFWLSGLA